MIIKHFCNSTFQGEFTFDKISNGNTPVSFGSLFTIGGAQYRVTNILIRNESEVVVESVKVATK